MENKELIIKWFESIRDNLNDHFPTRFQEPLEGQRGSEIGSVNTAIVECNNCIEYIKEFM